MKDLFLELLHKQPSGKVYFGGCSKDWKEVDKDDTGGRGGNLIIRSRQEYAISLEKRVFVVTYSEKTGMGESNQDLINQHLSYLRSLSDEGKLLFAGAYITGNRGLLIISAESIDDAATIINKDPLLEAEYFRKSDIEEIKDLNPKTF
ncbi:YciI family protein [Bacillus mycoides]|uniref:YciI family protein n=1 Tax=Bacillus mycoides TaxID=1405 RepID=UPI0036505059